MRRNKGWCILLTICLLLAAVSAPLAGSLALPVTSGGVGGDTAGSDGYTWLLGDETTETDGSDVASRDGVPDRHEPIPAGLSVWDGFVRTEDHWDQETVEAFINACPFAGGVGTASDPYEIATPEQFVQWIQLCNYSLEDPTRNRLFRELSYVLTQDLVFNPDFAVTEAVAAGTASGLHTVPTVTKSFSGTLKGAGHRLYNFYQTNATGLFSELSGGATISGLHLVRGYMGCRLNDAVAGGIAAVCNGKVTGCSVSATLSFANGGGGIVGIIGTQSGSVYACEFAGNLTADGFPTTRGGVAKTVVPGNATGGILGSYTTPIVALQLSECVNRGTVRSAGRMVGGIVGEIHNGGSSVGGFSISNCVNFGEIQSTYDPATDASAPTVARPSYVGGIVGYVNRVRRSGKKAFTNVANFGQIHALSTGSVGGILGSGQGTGDESGVLTMQYAYHVGTVSAPDRVGGLVGYASVRLRLTECAVSGQVGGGRDVGGMVGRVEPPSWYTSPSLRVDQTQMFADVTATSGAAGGIVGTYDAGGGAELTLGGVYVSSVVSAASAVGGWIGVLSVNRGDNGEYRSKTSLKLSAAYSASDVTLTAGGDGGSSGLWFGRSTGEGENITMPLSGSFSGICARERGDADFPRTVPGAEGSTTFASAYLTDGALSDGTLRDLLNAYAEANSYRKWEQTAECPMLPTIAHLLALPLSHAYNGEETSLEDNRWSGATVVARYWRYDAAHDTWEQLAASPKSVGRYRVEVAVLSLRASGAVTREFTIEKQVFDLSRCRWPEETSYEYIGEEQTVTLLGLPEVAVPVYEGNRATVRNTYTARLLSVDDPTGNYTFTNLASVPTFTWRIVEIEIDFAYVMWRGSTPENQQRATTAYTGEEQTLYLYYTKKPNIDLSKILTIRYTKDGQAAEGGIRAKNVGTYGGITAVIANDERFNSINPKNIQTNYPAVWEICKREINPEDYLDFSGAEDVLYDGKEHTVRYTSRLPDCVTVTFDATPQKDAGTYTYTVYCTLTSDTENNVLTAPSASRTLTIKPAPVKITAKGRDTVYSGEVQRIEEEKCTLNTDATNDTPLRFEYSLVSEEDGTLTPVPDNAPIHGGTYQVRVIFDGSNNYAPAAVTVPFYINRATLALEGDIVLRSAEMLYTGEPLNLKLENERHLPDCVIPVYSAARTEPGIYKVVVNFEFTEEHKSDYKPIAGMSATLTILTSRLTDPETGLQVRFPDGSPVPYRLLVLARRDLDAFNTNWSVGFHTSLKGLWKTELKEGKTPVTATEEPFDVYLPISVQDANHKSLTAVGLTIDENGKYTVKVYSDAEVVEVGEEMFLKISTTDVTYFGYTTRDSAAGEILWIVLAAIVAIPAAAVIVVEIVRRRRRKAADRHIDGE